MARRGLAVVAALAVVAGTSAAGDASAQTGLDPTTTTTTAAPSPTTVPTTIPPPTIVLPPTTVTMPPPAPPSTLALPIPSTTVPVPIPLPIDPVEAGHEADSEEEAPVDVFVPPPPVDVVIPPPPPDLLRVVGANLVQAKEAAARAAADRAAADARVRDLEYRLAEGRRDLDGLRASERKAVRRVLDARDRLRKRALVAYTGGQLHDLDVVLEANDINQLLRGMTFVEGTIRNGNAEVREYRQARQEVNRAAARRVREIDALEKELVEARQIAAVAAAVVVTSEVDLVAVSAGSSIVIHGFVFPVAGPHKFSNDFGNPRMMGTTLAHSHKGTDIFALQGTPLVACERGVVTKMGTDRLGGTKLWIVGASGTRYYYAHLSAFAPGIADGTVVEPGTLVGFVGDTGNAKGGAMHLHFEVHPRGGAAVNPFPLLKAVDGILPPAAPKPATTTSTAPPAPPVLPAPPAVPAPPTVPTPPAG